MVVSVDTPALAVVITRMTNRTASGPGGFAQPFQRVDITPYLGIAGTVTTQKTIGASCGAFALSFADQMHPEYGDTIYALLEPMDMVEIRGARHPEVYAGGLLPLIMRGFVTSVQRQEQMAEDGTPYRSVVVIGQDAGKLLDQYRILFEFATAADGKIWVEQFRLQAATGIQARPMGVSEFFTEVITKVVNPWIQRMDQFTQTEVKPFQVDASVPDGMVAPQLAAQVDMVSIWQLLEIFADRPWNEMFVKDMEDGPHLVFRPVPYKAFTDDSLIMHGAADPGTLTLDAADLVAISVQRSDFRVANFFWVEPGVSMIESNLYVTIQALQAGWPVDLKHDANTPVLFGPRKMQTRSALYPNESREVFSMLPNEDKRTMSDKWVTWQVARGRQLLALNEDNGQFEEGTLLVKGSEELVIGTYLDLTRGDTVSHFYIEAVTQQIRPLSSWQTQLGVVRGTGWRDRTKAPVPPYISEGRAGPYT